MTARQSHGQAKSKQDWHSRLEMFEWKASPYLYIAPFFILFLIVGLFPLLYTMWIATRQFNTLTGDAGFAVCGSTCGTTNASWFGNFMWVLHQPTFYVALRNSVSIFLLSSVPQIIIALWLAWVLDANLKAKTFWRMGVLLPYIVAPSAAGIIFSQVFSDKMGAINVLLQQIGMHPIMWFSNAWTARAVIIIALVWRWTGYNMVFYLSGMQNIEYSIYEAAKIDGASPLQTFFKITVPLLKPMILLSTITSTNGTLQLFDESLNLTNGGPGKSTMTMSHYIYNMSFVQSPNFGYAAAMSILILIMVAILALIQMKVGDER